MKKKQKTSSHLIDMLETECDSFEDSPYYRYMVILTQICDLVLSRLSFLIFCVSVLFGVLLSFMIIHR